MAQYDMNASLDSAHHFALADAAGRSVVVEYIDGEMVVTETHVVTNHYVAQREDLPEGFEASHLRFETLTGHREDHENRRNQWTLIFDQKKLTAEFYRWEDWAHPIHLTLKEEK